MISHGPRDVNNPRLEVLDMSSAHALEKQQKRKKLAVLNFHHVTAPKTSRSARKVNVSNEANKK